MCRFCYVVVSSKLQNSRLVYQKKRGGMGEFDVKSDVANLEESFDTKKHFGVCD